MTGGKRRRRKRVDIEPGWTAVPAVAERRDAVRTLSIVVRHLVPLVLVLALGGSIAQFLLLTLFNIAFTLACIGMVGVAVSMAGGSGERSTADSINTWSTLIGVAAFISVLLTALFGWVIVLMAGNEAGTVWDRTFVISIAVIVLGATPGIVRQYRADRASGLGEDERKRRDQPEVFVQVLFATLMLILSTFAVRLGEGGAIAMALIVTAAFIVRDLRPDIMRLLAANAPRE